MRTALVAVLLVVSAPAAWATSGSAGDGALAERLVISRSDAHPLFPRYLTSWGRSLCPLTTTAADTVTASASGNWGGVTIGLWSTAAVLASADAAAHLYERLVASQPACLLQFARLWGKSAHTGYKTHRCRWASIRPLAYGRYGDATRAWRATYSSRYRTGCTVHALDGVVVRTGRAVAVYLFGNALAQGRTFRFAGERPRRTAGAASHQPRSGRRLTRTASPSPTMRSSSCRVSGSNPPSEKEQARRPTSALAVLTDCASCDVICGSVATTETALFICSVAPLSGREGGKA